jgi:hypothetical protein
VRRSPRDHELKCWPAPFEAIGNGEKGWEFRLDDRGYAVGDTLVLREWEPGVRSYTGRVLRARVTWILHGGFGLPDGFVIMSLDVPSPRDVGMAVALAVLGAFLLGISLGLGMR